LSEVRRLVLCLALLAGGCRGEAPPGPTSEEAGQLDEAEGMLNDLAKEEGPENRVSGPSNQSN
jgi:hypothetical protein